MKRIQHQRIVDNLSSRQFDAKCNRAVCIIVCRFAEYNWILRLGQIIPENAKKKIK